MDSLLAALALALRPDNIATAIVVMNFAAFAAFGIDKSRAERGEWRISEGTLLRLAVFGGTPDAYAGRFMFRHKTKKQPFCANLRTIAVLQLFTVAVLVVYVWSGDPLGLSELI